MNTSGGASFDTSGRRNFVTVDMGADMGLISSKSGDRKTAAMSNGVTVDMGKVKVASGVISPLVGNYTEDFKTNYSKAQKLGYIKLIFVLKGKP